MRAIDRLLRHRPTAGGMSLAGKIRALFSNGEQGWWYDPSNFATLFQDSAGTTPVTAVEQPVGLQLDLSKGLVLGPELVTLPYSIANTNWSASGTSYVKSAVGNNTGTPSNITAPQAGKNYKITFTASGLSGQTCYVSFGGASNLSALAGRIATAGDYSFTLCTTTTSALAFVPYEGGAFAVTISNVSVRELPGNHRFQSTSANRPVVSARVNLLTKTEDFSNAAWQKLVTGTGVLPVVTPNYGTAPDGTQTAARIQLDRGVLSTSVSLFYQEFTTISGFSLSDVAYIKTNDGSTKTISFGDSAAGPDVITVTGAWQLFTSTKSVAQANRYMEFGVRSTTSQTADLLIWHPDARSATQGVGLPDYQRVNTSTDYDSTGFPVYIKPNGSNQFMQTNSINFTATDKMTVWQGVRKLGTTGAFPLELSASSDSNNGTFAIGTDSSGFEYFLRSHGTALQQVLVDNAAYASPVTNVVQVSANISGPSVSARINGASVGTNTSSQGTGNYGNYPAYFYARNGASNFFNGNDYGSIARGAASTAAQITNGETWINQRTKAY